MHLIAIRRTHRLAKMADQRIRPFQEHQGRFLGFESQFLDMVGIVEAERENGCAGRNRRQPMGLRQGQDFAARQA